MPSTTQAPDRTAAMGAVMADPARLNATPGDAAFARRARRVALAVAGTMLLWLGAQAAGGRMGWDPRLALIFDLAALAAFVWALVAAWRLWQSRTTRDT